LALGDTETAARFGLSSMEMAAQAGDPEGGGEGAPRTLSVVTELPLFVLEAPHEREPGVPVLLNRYEALRLSLAEAVAAGRDLAPLVAPLGLRALGLETAVRLHLRTLDLALDAVG
ncbi:MAG TPA: hypothetical protein VF576_09005, partial [Rubricoccaceae bacterium]